MNIKKGDKLKIECYKHNGYLDRTSDEATVIHVDKEMLVVANNHTKLTEHDGKSHTTNEPAVLFFYKNKWFNIIGQLKKNGLFYYCNIATPFIIEEGTIKYIDYDLDLRIFPSGEFKILDKFKVDNNFGFSICASIFIKGFISLIVWTLFSSI